MDPFTEAVYSAVKSIPAGRVATYGQIAALAGRPRSARAVGACMRGCTEKGVPCHRVLFHDGSICGGDAFSHPMVQKQLLQGEGVVFLKNGKVDMRLCRWRNE